MLFLSAIEIEEKAKFLESVFVGQEVGIGVVHDYCLFCELFGEENVVITGSRVIGGFRDNSDFDFVVAPVDAEQSLMLNNDQLPAGHWRIEIRTLEHAKPMGHHISRTLQGAPMIETYRFGWVNLIIDHRGPAILDNWRIATDYCIENAVTNKRERINWFEHFGT